MFTVSTTGSVGALIQQCDTLSDAISLTLRKGDLSNVAITNQHTGERISGQQIAELAAQLGIANA